MYLEHLNILKQGANTWNTWRKEHGDIRPHLSGADLGNADLSYADLSEADLQAAHLGNADLRFANLSEADLQAAHLGNADLRFANLRAANLRTADLRFANLRAANLQAANLRAASLRFAHLSPSDRFGTDLRDADLSNSSSRAYIPVVVLCEADLRGADLGNADLSHANLRGADLRGASLIGVDFSGAKLSGATLISANLRGADLRYADLSEADLSEADLSRADLSRANLRGADLSKALVEGTSFGNVDLSVAKGLETVVHLGPSTIGIDTIFLSHGNIPEVFLKGAGVDDTFITYIRSLVGKAIEYYSCFISYSSKDDAFAKRLYADLQNNNVRCWFAPEDLKWGERIRTGIDEAIRLHDKLLLILSRHSVASGWVEREVKTALARERKEKSTVLFPVRVDSAVFESPFDWATEIRHERNIGDFTHWKDHDEYQKAFDRLLRDLKAEAQKTE